MCLVLALALVLGGCAPKGDRPGTRAPARWPHATPELAGDQLVRGDNAQLVVVGAPEGAVVTIEATRVGIGAGPCPDAYDGCAAIRDPEPWSTELVADERGEAGFRLAVPADEVPGAMWFQARVFDPELGVGTWSTFIQRDVALHPSESAVDFQDVTATAGVRSAPTTGNSHTGGVAWIDYNGDLWPDLFTTNGSGSRHRLFRNNGNGTFAEVSQVVAKPDEGLEDAAACYADVENDGDLDLFVAVDNPLQVNSDELQPMNGGPNLLYINDGAGGFTQEASQRGVVHPDGWRTITCGFADFDADGFVDLYLGTWAMNQEETTRHGRWLRNDGTGHFADSGVVLAPGQDVLTALTADLDQDGWTDLYLGHVHHTIGFSGSLPPADDRLYRNDHGALVEVTAQSPGLGDDAWAAMGIDAGDVDNDGDFDLYLTDRWDTDDPLPRGNPLYLNHGDLSFADNRCDVAGVCTGYAGWPTSFADFDRDGWVDLWVGTGKTWDPDLLYINDGDGTFTNHAVRGFGDRGPRGGAVADFDGDGAVDLALWQYLQENVLFRNKPRDDHHWVELQLEGTRANRAAIGAVVTVRSGGTQQLRRVSGGDSAHSHQSQILHVGLGTRDAPVEVEILWPGGETQVLTDVPIDRLVLLNQDSGVVSQSLIEVDATWTAATSELRVVATTTYGGRGRVDAPFYGALTWDPELAAWVGEFAAVALPSAVELQGAWGGAWVVPVSYVP